LLINKLRAAGFTCPRGTVFAPNPEPLKFDCRLWKASKLHSQDMAENDYFSHQSQDGRSPWDRAREQGTSANGENIAYGHSSAQRTLEQFEKSDGHCKNMMSSSFKVAAIGYFDRHWTQMYSRSDGSDLDTSCYPAATAAMAKVELSRAEVMPHSSRPEGVAEACTMDSCES
jgi:uncharacterized protein YkwD